MKLMLWGQSRCEEHLDEPVRVDYVSRKGKQSKSEERGVKYVNRLFAFDIETSSFTQNGRKGGCLVCWQIADDMDVIIGRTPDELTECFTRLASRYCHKTKSRMVVYVHNLSYEFQWMKKILRATPIRSHGVREITGAVFHVDTVHGDRVIELRDSLALSNCSLEQVGKNLYGFKIVKTKGWDYSKIRHTETPLTYEELHYAANDVRVVVQYIREKLTDPQTGEVTDTLATIPNTSTGYVRRYCRQNTIYGANMFKYRDLIRSTCLDEDRYLLAKAAFQGGFTHANPNYVGKTVEMVATYDLCSAYPAIMLSRQYPMELVTTQLPSSTQELLNMCDNFCVFMEIDLEGVEEKPNSNNLHILSKSKCIISGDSEFENGRLIHADHVRVTLCDIELLNILKTYNITGEITPIKVACYRKDYLPKEFVECILHFYTQKTVLKNVPNMEVMYSYFKGLLNSTYGMAVTDIFQPKIEFDRASYTATEVSMFDRASDSDEDTFIKSVARDNEINNYNTNKSRFLSYLWGIYVTAYTRDWIYEAIRHAGEAFVYSDTDSVKVLLEIAKQNGFVEWIDEQNKMELAAIKEAFKYWEIPEEAASPKDANGKPHTLGMFELEDVAMKFKTLGAKRYLAFKKSKSHPAGVLVPTVAGCSKSGLAQWLSNQPDPFEAFTHDMRVPAKYTHRLTATYIDDEWEGDVTDYFGNTLHVTTPSFTHLEPTDFTLDMDHDGFIMYLFGLNHQKTLTMI